MEPFKCIAILYGGWIYANDHLSLSMNINGNFRNKRKIIKMKLSRAAGQSGVVVGMIRAAVDTGATVICDLAIHSTWEGPG